MIVSESEAGLLTCPAAAVFDPGNGSTPKCASVACAAWRWFGIRSPGGPIDNSGTGLALASSAEVLPEDYARVGHCGLAGRP